MRHFVSGEIGEHRTRRQNEPPGERQHAGGRTGTPTARLIAHRDPPDADAERRGEYPAGDVEIALGLAAQEIADTTIDVPRVAGDAKQPLAARVDFRPYRAAHAGPVHDAVRFAAQRHHGAIGEGHGFRQPAEPRRDPTAVLLGEFARVLERAARRDGEDHLPGRRLDAQGVAPRLAVPAQLHEIDRSVENDLDRPRLSRAAIEQRTQRHGSSSRPKNLRG